MFCVTEKMRPKVNTEEEEEEEEEAGGKNTFLLFLFMSFLPLTLT